MPLPTPRLLQPPFVAGAILALAVAAAGLDTRVTNVPLLIAAAAVAVAVVGAAWLIPWQRLPLYALLMLPVACDGVIVLLRQSQGGSTSGYAPLAILPVLWVGLAFSRRGVAVMTVATFLMFALPILLIGAPMYPNTGWRGVVLWTVVAGVVGMVANRVMAAQRRETLVASNRAEELRRLVETQSAIGTAASDLDGVLKTVVQQALEFTQAEAAVVELPEGTDMVYRATAGTADHHLNLRIKRDGSISGRALAEQAILICRDSETDPRVDREACRRVGARSLVVVPLWDGERAAGVLKVYSSIPDAFEPRAAQLLEMLAGMTAAALVRAQLLGRLNEQATRDELTGLVNRREWYRQLDLAIVRARRSEQSLSIVILDVNGLKLVNDRDGHAAGDRLLRRVSSRWSSTLRESDVLGRIGGDEFGIILDQAGEVAAAEVVDRLRAALDADQSAAAGIATWDGVESAEQLVDRADDAMYRQKRARSALL
jgi:diguanylate cyclase (GGDEF)-like protein